MPNRINTAVYRRGHRADDKMPPVTETEFQRGAMIRRKYGNVRTEYNGRQYASRLEADTAQRLDLLIRASDTAERVHAWQPQPGLLYGVLDKWRVYTPDFRVEFWDEHIEYWECKGLWTEAARLRLDYCRDWMARNGTPITVRVIYADHEEVLR